MIEFGDKIKKRKKRIAVIPAGGRYERGVKVGQTYQISALEVWTLTSEDDIANMQSWPEGELCPQK